MLELLASAGSAVVKILFGRWLNPDVEKEVLKDDLQAKEREAESMEAPARGKPDVVASLRRDLH